MLSILLHLLFLLLTFLPVSTVRPEIAPASCKESSNRVWEKRLKLLFVAVGSRVSLEIIGICASLGGWDVPDVSGAMARCVPTCCSSREEPHTSPYMT